MSDSRQFTNKDAGVIIIKGLDFAPFYFCPHFDRDVKRKEVLPMFIKKTHKKWIVLEEGTAFLVKNNQWKIVKSKPQAQSYLYYHRKGEVVCQELSAQDFQALSVLS